MSGGHDGSEAVVKAIREGAETLGQKIDDGFGAVTEAIKTDVARHEEAVKALTEAQPSEVRVRE